MDDESAALPLRAAGSALPGSSLAHCQLDTLIFHGHKRDDYLVCVLRRVPLRIICIPLFNWIYAKGSERGMPGLAHTVRGVWHFVSSEVLIRLCFPKGVGDIVWQ